MMQNGEIGEMSYDFPSAGTAALAASAFSYLRLRKNKRRSMETIIKFKI